jgi:glucose dehydrogenase
MKPAYALIRPLIYVQSICLILALVACKEQAPVVPEVQTPTPVTDAAVTAPVPPAAVNAERMADADSEPGSWMSHGRTYDEQRFSPLDSINDRNAERLGLSWYFDFPTRRGMQATPLMIDGVVYVSGAWSMVYAFDAVSGELLWKYDPQVPRAKALQLCCDAINRGVAAWEGKIFVGTLDGRLVALDAADGSVAWEVWTTPKDSAYSITGAPRVVKGKVVIGNGGSEFGVRVLYGARGSLGTVRKPGPGDGIENVDRGMVEARRRRDGLGLHGLRRRTRSALHWSRERLTLEPPDPKPPGR